MNTSKILIRSLIIVIECNYLIIKYMNVNRKRAMEMGFIKPNQPTGSVPVTDLMYLSGLAIRKQPYQI